jgi:hypothetical protein
VRASAPTGATDSPRMGAGHQRVGSRPTSDVQGRGARRPWSSQGPAADRGALANIGYSASAASAVRAAHGQTTVRPRLGAPLEQCQ